MNKSFDNENPSMEQEARRSMSPLWWLGGLAVAAFLSRALVKWNTTVPLCGFREMAGIPCPLCGGTRTMRSFSELDLVSAFQFNPLVFGAVISILGWAIVKTLDGVFGTALALRSTNTLAKLPVAFVALVLVLANWLYLIWFLP